MSDLIKRLNDELGQTANTAASSLVQISNGWRGHGAGIVVHPEGLILTNGHVMRRDSVKVTLSDGRTLPARLLARYKDHDLALLRVDAADLPAIALGASKNLRAGEWVIALGHPWGVPGAATAGVVIGVGDALPERPNFGAEWLAVDLHLRPGHSGGPIVDSAGRLVGVNTVMAGPDVGLAIPVDVVKRFMKEALQAESKAA
jgi:S1-C subfamily serine protease